MIKLVATDMDGTFLNRQGSFDKARLRAVLDDFAQKGILFAAASGRPLLALEKMFADYHHLLSLNQASASQLIWTSLILYWKIPTCQATIFCYQAKKERICTKKRAMNTLTSLASIMKMFNVCQI